jgi:hypothetical protein
MEKMFKDYWLSVVVLLLLASPVWAADKALPAKSVQKLTIDQTINAKGADARIKEAFLKGKSDLWVTSQGRVVKVLIDDNDGSRHQRFLLKLSNGHTVLIAHNIDLAPRVPDIKMGDMVTFYGEYKWNNKGGVIHWTHHDPSGRKTGGWLMHMGKKYD